jgi:hypothetical protein
MAGVTNEVLRQEFNSKLETYRDNLRRNLWTHSQFYDELSKLLQMYPCSIYGTDVGDMHNFN